MIMYKNIKIVHQGWTMFVDVLGLHIATEVEMNGSQLSEVWVQESILFSWHFLLRRLDSHEEPSL